MTPQETAASIEVAIFILMGLVVIPLVWSYLNKGRKANITVKPNMYKPGEQVQSGGGATFGGNVSYGSSVPRDIPASKYQVKEDFYQEQLERYEEREKRQQSKKETSFDS